MLAFASEMPNILHKIYPCSYVCLENAAASGAYFLVKTL